MGLSGIIYKTHGNEHIRVFLVVQPVNTPFSKEGESCHSKGDGVRHTGLSPAISAGNNCWIAKGQFCGFLIALEAGNGHASDLKRLDLSRFYAACPWDSAI